MTSAAAITAAAVVAAAVVLAGAKAQPTADQVAAQQAAREAVTVVLLPYAFDRADLQPGRAAISARAGSMKDQVGQRLAKIMTPERAGEWKAKIAEALIRQTSGESNIDLAGGIDSIEFSETNVDGASATVVGTVKVWQDYAEPNSFKVTRGSGWYDFTVTELRNGTSWLVSDAAFEQHVARDPNAIPNSP